MDVVMRAQEASYHIGGAALLHGVTVGLAHGSVHALIGPNGAGKSTLLRLLAGDLVPTAGDVFLEDRRLRDYSKKELALRRAVMPQDVALALAFTGEEVVMMGRYPHMARKPRAATRKHRSAESEPRSAARKPLAAATDPARGATDHQAIVDEMMRLTETDALRRRLYPSLSGGEQARITLARALAQQTPILFLDEPTASLDPRHQHLVMRLARRHARAGGTVLAVLHDLNLAAAYADDIILLCDGRIRAQGPPADVLKPSLLDEVFQARFYVTDHPRLPHPLVLSLPLSD